MPSRISDAAPGRRSRLRRLRGALAWAALGAAVCAAPVEGAAPTWRIRARLAAESSARGESLEQVRAELVADTQARGRGALPERGLDRMRTLAGRGKAAVSLAEIQRWTVFEGRGDRDLATLWTRLSCDPRFDLQLFDPGATLAQVFTPDDPLLPNQAVMLAQVDALRAWARVRGEQGGVIVAIVDGGTDWRHPDLLANVWVNPAEIDGNGVDDDGNGFVDDVHGWNFAEDGPDPSGLPAQTFNRAHGTHVAGLAAAVTHNARGVTGTSFNARLMPINASDPERDTGIAYGYEGILYAASMGAHVVNCSWRAARDGGRASAPFNPFENAIVEAATALGTLVVAATGNDGSDALATTPAFYPSVLSVTGTLLQDRVLWGPANGGAWVDLAAPATTLVSTEPSEVVNVGGGPYGPRSGTSMAAPVVAGIAALVRTLHPEWTPEQVRQQLRATAFDLTASDLQRGRWAGAGLVQAGPATEDRVRGAVHLEDVRLDDQDGDGLPEGGEVLAVRFTLRSAIAFDGAVTVDLGTDDPYLLLLEDGLRIPRLQAGGALDVRRGLSAVLRFDTPPGHIARLDFTLTPEGHRPQRQSAYLEVVPLHAVVRGTGVEMSVVATGKLGFADAARAFVPAGRGLNARSGDTPAFLVAGLVLGNGPARVSDAIQAPRPLSEFEDFRPIQGQALSRVADPLGVRDELRLSYSDLASSPRLGVGIEQRALAFADDGRAGFVLCEWTIKAELDSIAGLVAGVLVDWAGDPGSERGERVRTDPGRRMQWVEPADGDSGARPLAGVAVLEGPGEFRSHWLWTIGPDEEREGPFLFDLGDLRRKISDSDLWRLLQGDPTRGLESGEGNVAGVVSMGPVDLARGARARLALCFVVGADFDELLGRVSMARATWAAMRAGGGTQPVGPTRLLFSAPNPTRSGADLYFVSPRAQRVRLELFDLRGRRVRLLVDEWVDAGYHRRRWDGNDPVGRPVASGVYHARLRAGSEVDVQRLTVVR